MYQRRSRLGRRTQEPDAQGDVEPTQRDRIDHGGRIADSYSISGSAN